MALNPGNDMEHDESLAKLYRAAANEAPPARIDAAIRAAARRETGAGPRPLSRLRAWRVPVSLAAMLVLSATLVLMMREEGADRLETAVELLPPPAAPTGRPMEPPSRPAESQAPAFPSRELQSRAPAAEPPLAAPQASPPVEQKVIVGNAAPPLPEATSEPLREMAATTETARPMIRAVPAPAAADASGRVARSAPAASAVAGGAAAPPLWQDLADQPAEKWVERILEWQRAGRSADAEALVREFRRRFPEQPLPAEIRQP